MLMSKAPGVPLHQVPYRLAGDGLLRNPATLIVSISTHRFSHVGSSYQNLLGTDHQGLVILPGFFVSAWYEDHSGTTTPGLTATTEGGDDGRL
jgi:hypothetical protein